MTKINLIMMLLPVVFMVHEYEEIMMFRRWIDRNREELRKRFPKIESFFTRQGVFDGGGADIVGDHDDGLAVLMHLAEQVPINPEISQRARVDTPGLPFDRINDLHRPDLRRPIREAELALLLVET